MSPVHVIHIFRNDDTWCLTGNGKSWFEIRPNEFSDHSHGNDVLWTKKL